MSLETYKLRTGKKTDMIDECYSTRKRSSVEESIAEYGDV